MVTLPNPLPKLMDGPGGGSPGLRLPAGQLVSTTYDGPWHEPLLWYADGPVDVETLSALREPVRRVGLLPVVLETGTAHGAPETWDLAPGDMSYPGDHDSEEVLADYWKLNQPSWPDEADGLEETLAPYGTEWPGLAPAPPAPFPGEPEEEAAEVVHMLLEPSGKFQDPRLALVPARRSADVPAAIGWTGPVNHENDTGVLCSVLRSWEDRFGARVVALGFDQLFLSVVAPPTTLEEAWAVAAEHYAFCPDNITQGYEENLRDYAREQVLDRPLWSFWWD
jgi:Domain of unknown function (DUF4253)